MATAPSGDRTQAVLIIDDEDYVADMIATALELEGYAIYVAYNGRDGLQQARALRVDLIVLDIMMPYMSGVELIAHLRDQESSSEVPVILISAGARPPRPLPHVTFVPKPFNINALLDLIAEQIGKPESRDDGV